MLTSRGLGTVICPNISLRIDVSASAGVLVARVSTESLERQVEALATLGFSCGCDAKDIRSVRWENLWEKDSEEIRTEYNIIAYDKNVYKKSYTQKLGMT